MKSSKLNWFALKKNWQEELSAVYDAQEANNILQILAEELLPHYARHFFREHTFELTEQDYTILLPNVERLKKQEPLQYILGKAWFYDLELQLNPFVLIPRPETEELVSWVLENIGHAKTLLDIGTGSGCIPLSIKKHAPELQVHALDVDSNVIALATRNATTLNLDVSFSVHDILSEKEREDLGKFDIIVSNPPYIPEAEKELMLQNVLAFEPHLALFVKNEDALIFYREIAKFAKKHLQKDGQLYFECNEYNANEVASLLKAIGFDAIEIRKDLQGKNRMIQCTLKTL